MKAEKQVKNSWNYDAPQYDQRSSCFVNAGTYHGVGYKNPVGTLSQTTKSAVPYGKIKTLSLNTYGYHVEEGDK